MWGLAWELAGTYSNTYSGFMAISGSYVDHSNSTTGTNLFAPSVMNTKTFTRVANGGPAFATLINGRTFQPNSNVISIVL